MTYVNNYSGRMSILERYLNEIMDVCRTNNKKLELAVTNLRILVSSLKKYQVSPKYYESFLQLTESSSLILSIDNQTDSKIVVEHLESIFDRKLNIKYLQKLGSVLALKTGLHLDRGTKRSKPLLIKWFSKYWDILHQKIYEYGLQSFDFE